MDKSLNRTKRSHIAPTENLSQISRQDYHAIVRALEGLYGKEMGWTSEAIQAYQTLKQRILNKEIHSIWNNGKPELVNSP